MLVESGADFGLSIDGFSPAGDIAAQARAAEAGGARTLWVATHLFLRDPVALASAALAATTELKVALMAMSPFALHPVHAAMAAATLDELYPGRVVLSLGVGAPGDLSAADIEVSRPLGTLEDAIGICRALFAGEACRLGERRLVNAPCQVPIVLAASGPKMLELAGSKADGAIISGATSVPFVRWCLDHVQRGAQGRAIATHGIVYTRIGGADDLTELRRTLGFILRGQHHSRNVALAGLDLDQAGLRTAYAAEDWDAVEALVSDAVMGAHAACGAAETVRARLAKYHAAGLDEVVLGGVTEPTDIAATFAAIA